MKLVVGFWGDPNWIISSIMGVKSASFAKDFGHRSRPQELLNDDLKRDLIEKARGVVKERPGFWRFRV